MRMRHVLTPKKKMRDEATMAAATATKKEKIYNVSTANCVVSGGWHLQSCTFQFNYVSSVGFVRSMIFQKHRFSSAPKLSADASRWSSGATMWTERAQYIDIEREADWAVHLRFIRLPVPDNFQHIFTHQKSAQHHLPGTTSPKTELSHSLANDSHLRWPNRRIMDHARTRNFNFMWCANTFAFISETRNFYEFEFEWQRAEGANGGSGRTAEQKEMLVSQENYHVAQLQWRMIFSIHQTHVRPSATFYDQFIVCGVRVHAIESHTTALARTNKQTKMLIKHFEFEKIIMIVMAAKQ